MSSRPAASPGSNALRNPDITNKLGYAWTGIDGNSWPKATKGAATTTIDLAKAWRRFVDGFDWTMDDNEDYIRERLRKLRTKFAGDLTDSDALNQWKHKRASDTRNRPPHDQFP